ncbi:MAG: hypothetical protein NVS1B4_00720 [Gemmatimonadaceae bacterium]
MVVVVVVDFVAVADAFFDVSIAIPFIDVSFVVVVVVAGAGAIAGATESFTTVVDDFFSSVAQAARASIAVARARRFISTISSTGVGSARGNSPRSIRGRIKREKIGRQSMLSRANPTFFRDITPRRPTSYPR